MKAARTKKKTPAKKSGASSAHKPVRVSSRAATAAAVPGAPECAKPARIFLLSPANAAGVRARMVASDNAKFDLALRLRGEGVPLGELFAFISGLYFRGKMAYATAFGARTSKIGGAFVITASAGLIEPHALITRERLREISAADVSAADQRYRGPLERDARELARLLGPNCEVVLLGSIATPKYVEPLLAIFGERLLFPAEFVGRGDMSRGGLMLRSARSGEQLTYVPVASAVRHGPRPPKLPKLPYGSLAFTAAAAAGDVVRK